MHGEADSDAVHAAAAAGSELRLQHSVAIFSFVLGAAGALYSLIIEALCDDPSWFDDFLTLLWSKGPHIVLKRHRTDSSQMRV